MGLYQHQVARNNKHRYPKSLPRHAEATIEKLYPEVFRCGEMTYMAEGTRQTAQFGQACIFFPPAQPSSFLFRKTENVSRE